MKNLLFLIIVSLMLTRCVAVPMYDSGYYPNYGQYSLGYVRPEVSIFVPFFHGGHDFRGGHGFRGGHSFRGGHGFRGGRR
jgi:hypothetical protein